MIRNRIFGNHKKCITLLQSSYYLVFPLTLCTLQLENQLLGGLGLLPQDGLGLASESLLLAVISDLRRS